MTAIESGLAWTGALAGILTPAIMKMYNDHQTKKAADAYITDKARQLAQTKRYNAQLREIVDSLAKETANNVALRARLDELESRNPE